MRTQSTGPASSRTAIVTAAILALVALPSVALAHPAAPGFERSTDDALAQKRYVAAGDRAYAIGAEDGGFPPMGWHIRGEMGGIWAHPIKLLDGYWFSVNGRWLPAATRFASGAGYTRMTFPSTRGARRADAHLLARRQSCRARRPAADQPVASSQARCAGHGQPQRADGLLSLGRDDAHRRGGQRARRRVVRPPLRPARVHRTWQAVVRRGRGERRSRRGRGRESVLGPGPEIGAPGLPRERQRHRRSRALGAARPGARVDHAVVCRRGVRPVGRTRRRPPCTTRLPIRRRCCGARSAPACELLGRTRVSLPDRSLQAAFDWGKLNLADLRRTVYDAEIRDVDEGRAYPSPVATVPELTGIGAGYPDYPWLFGTDGAYTAYPLVASGQWDTAEEHLRSIRDVSRIVNGATGKVVHEVVTDGSVYFGANDDAGNTNETAQFANAVALIWRWSGDNAFRDEMYDFVVDGMHHVTTALDADSDLWPEGNGMVERTGMGSEKLDVTAYTWQALGAVAEMATSRGDAVTAEWALAEAQAIEQRFDSRWWLASESLYADSLCNPGDGGEAGTNVCTTPDQALEQGHWINATPMEAGLAPAGHAGAALDRLESPAHTGDCGLFHTAAGGGPDGQGELKCWTLGSAVMAVAEATYGRLGPGPGPALHAGDRRHARPRDAGGAAGDHPESRLRPVRGLPRPGDVHAGLVVVRHPVAGHSRLPGRRAERTRGTDRGGATRPRRVAGPRRQRPARGWRRRRRPRRPARRRLRDQGRDAPPGSSSSSDTCCRTAPSQPRCGSTDGRSPTGSSTRIAVARSWSTPVAAGATSSS